jgi:sugar phosphate isomerase/epimerase
VKISMTHLTIADSTPAEFVQIAAQIGCDHICLFPRLPVDTPIPLPFVTDRGAARELKNQIDAAGLSVCNVEAFFCAPGVEPSSYQETLEIAAILGARRMTCLNMHPDAQGAVERLGSFSELAHGFGLTVGLEWTRRSQTKTLQDALVLISKVRQPNVELCVDVLHLMRNGGRPSDLAAVDPSLVRYAQISDGPLIQPEESQRQEAVFDRQYPGEGEFPLVDFVNRLSSSTVLAIETPATRLAASLTPLQRARRAMEGTRRVLSASEI